MTPVHIHIQIDVGPTTIVVEDEVVLTSNEPYVMASRAEVEFGKATDHVAALLAALVAAAKGSAREPAHRG